MGLTELKSRRWQGSSFGSSGEESLSLPFPAALAHGPLPLSSKSVKLDRVFLTSHHSPLPYNDTGLTHSIQGNLFISKSLIYHTWRIPFAMQITYALQGWGLGHLWGGVLLCLPKVHRALFTGLRQNTILSWESYKWENI